MRPLAPKFTRQSHPRRATRHKQKGIPPNQGRIEPTPDSRTMTRHSAGASRAILALAVASLCLGVQVSAALGPNSQLLLRSPSVAPRAAASSGSLLHLKGGFEPQCGRSLRIALCAWESLHSIAVGGVAPHVTELAAGLARRGHEVHLYVRAGSDGACHEELHGVHVHRVPIDLVADFVSECDGMCNKMVWYMKETESYMNAQFDIVHCHDWLAAKALVQMKQAGRRCILTMHSTEYGRCGNQNFEGNSARVRAVEQEGIDYADRVISVSGRLCDEVKSQFHCDDKIRMAYNGIHLNQYEGFVDCGEIKGQYGIGAMQPTILYVARLVVQKGPDIMLEAMPEILQQRSDAVCIFVGDGHLREELEDRARELGIEHAIRWLGSMGGDPLKSLFKACDLVCVPSRNEPFGIVVLEGWASGKVVVATNSGGPGEFVRHEDDGFHVYPEPGSVAWGVKQVFSDFDRSRQMGLRGRDRCAHEFSWDMISEQTESVYLEVC